MLPTLISVSWCAVVVAANRELRNGHKNAFDALHVYVKWLVGENANSPNNILTFVATQCSCLKHNGVTSFLNKHLWQLSAQMLDCVEFKLVIS